MKCEYTTCVNWSSKLCETCKHNYPALHNYFQSYVPACPKGVYDCVIDPAYIKYYHPDLYANLYGDMNPEAAILTHTDCHIDNDDCGYDDGEMERY